MITADLLQITSSPILFFSLFQGGSVTTILHVFGKLSKNYYVVSLMLKSGFEKRKNKITIQLPQSMVAIISFPGIKLLKLKNQPFECVQVLTHLYSYQERLWPFVGLRHGYFADQPILEEVFFFRENGSSAQSVCSPAVYSIKKGKRKQN